MNNCKDCNCILDTSTSINGLCEDCNDKLHCSNCGIELDTCELAHGECDSCYRESGGI